MPTVAIATLEGFNELDSFIAPAVINARPAVRRFVPTGQHVAA